MFGNIFLSHRRIDERTQLSRYRISLSKAVQLTLIYEMGEKVRDPSMPAGSCEAVMKSQSSLTAVDQDDQSNSTNGGQAPLYVIRSDSFTLCNLRIKMANGA